jgi:hypothetical protein
MSAWLHALECVVLPCVVGATMFLLFEVWDRRRARARPERALPVIDYQI